MAMFEKMVLGDKFLIKEVNKYPFIYDQKHIHHKNVKLKIEAWTKIATAMNVEPDDAKHRWRNLRDRFVKEKKLILKEGAEVYQRHNVWPYLQQMSFLWDLIIHRKNIPLLIPEPMQEYNGALLNVNHSGEGSNLGNIRNGDIIEVDPFTCSLNEQTLEDNSNLQPQSKHPEESRVDTPNSHRSDYSSLQEANNLVKQAPYPRSPSLSDEDGLFCESVTASLKRFTAKTKAATKIKIQQILFDAEFQ